MCPLLWSHLVLWGEEGHIGIHHTLRFMSHLQIVWPFTTVTQKLGKTFAMFLWENKRHHMNFKTCEFQGWSCTYPKVFPYLTWFLIVCFLLKVRFTSPTECMNAFYKVVNKASKYSLFLNRSFFFRPNGISTIAQTENLGFILTVWYWLSWPLGRRYHLN